MRHRRAERCLLRAQGALDAGLEAEARAALDEARGLNPDTPSFDELLAAARLRREADAAKVRRQRTRRAALVAVAGLIVSLGVGWAVFEQRDTAGVETLAALPEPSSSSVPQATTGTKAPEADRPPLPHDTGVESPSGRPDADPGVEPETPAPRTVPAPPPVARERIAERRVADPRPPTPADTPRSAQPKTPAPTTTENIASPTVDTSLTPGVLGAPLTASMNAPTPPPEAAPAPEAPSAPKAASPPAEPVSQEPAVRAVLAQFAEAYSSLSASAARQVWPSVDARSLSRAFEGLQSQQVSLGNCNVKVAASTARAECSGSATWTPKIGGGQRTEARRWEFDLARSNGGWLIVQARAR